jgi:hypothetical protein
MKIGDAVEIRMNGSVLGRAHVWKVYDDNIVTLKAAPRVLPDRLARVSVECMTPNASGDWVVDISRSKSSHS